MRSPPTPPEKEKTGDGGSILLIFNNNSIMNSDNTLSNLKIIYDRVTDN